MEIQERRQTRMLEEKRLEQEQKRLEQREEVGKGKTVGREKVAVERKGDRMEGKPR